MIRRILYIFLSGLIFIITSCSDEMDFSERVDANGELPVEFMFDMPQDCLTRALSGAKKSFKNGDVIHISGEFTLSNGNKEIRYGALSFNSQGKWMAVTDSKLTWPNTAVSGVFTAYHVPTLNVALGSIITNNDKNISRLQDVTLTSDPLFARTPEGSSVKYGNGVRLQFSHLLTYLTLENLTPAYSQFIFSTENYKENENAPVSPFNNAFYLQLNPDNTLSFGFDQYQESDGSYDITSTTVKNADNLNSGNVSFFLQPGYYEKFTISYPTGGSDNPKTPFLNYVYSPIQDEENTAPILEAGVAYTLNTVTSSGIIIQSPSEEDNKPWDSENPVQVDIDAFLTAILKTEEYVFEGKNILTRTSTGLKLNYNINFNDTVYIWLKNGNLPVVPTGQIFDGDNHTLYNLACPLFDEINGSLTNLGINRLNAVGVILDQHQYFAEQGYKDFSRQGGLCRKNKGEIVNVRMTDISMTAFVNTDNDSDNEEAQDTENIGLIAGSNTGLIDNVRLAGDFSLTLNTYASDTDGSNCTINAGGLVGQNTNNGRINDVASLDEGGGLQKIRVVNNCTSTKGAYYVGGIVGYNESYIGPIGVPFIEIDCSGSVCTKSFIGLITGEITTTTGTSSTIVGANVSGSAKAGEIEVYNDLDSGSYVGGIAGASVLPNGGTGISITDCMVVAQLLDNNQTNAEDAINCTGGCFGRIYSPFTVNNITLSLGRILYPGSEDGLNYFAGTFAGLAPENQSWSWDGIVNRLVTNTSGIEDAIGSTSL